jgi:hypothetical protein
MFIAKKIEYEEFVKNLDTGDIILYQTSFWYSRVIEYFTKSPYSHISIVLKSPTWLDDKLTEDYYLLESGAEVFPDADTGEMIFGVQIAPLKKVYDEYRNKNYGHLYYRKLTTTIPMDEIQNKIKEAYGLLKGKPYDVDPCDWLAAYHDENKPLDDISGYQKTNCFWCSALVSFVYSMVGFLQKPIPWTIITPNDFSYLNHRLHFIDCSLENDTLLI